VGVRMVGNKKKKKKRKEKKEKYTNVATKVHFKACAELVMKVKCECGGKIGVQGKEKQAKDNTNLRHHRKSCRGCRSNCDGGVHKWYMWRGRCYKNCAQHKGTPQPFLPLPAAIIVVKTLTCTCVYWEEGWLRLGEYVCKGAIQYKTKV